MKGTNKLQRVKVESTYSDVWMYKDMTLPMVMLQGWFNDQHDCFRVFYEGLTDEEQSNIFTSKRHLDSAKARYKGLWDTGKFDTVASKGMGEHKLFDQLSYSNFSYWARCVSNAVTDEGSLEILLASLGTVEAAHDKLKPWFKTRKVRGLNAADAARVLARYDYLRPEGRPLLARGALRGAVICLNREDAKKDVEELEREYADPSERLALEEKTAKFIRGHEELSAFGEWMMEEGESWFCNVVHKQWPLERRRR